MISISVISGYWGMFSQNPPDSTPAMGLVLFVIALYWWFFERGD